MHRTPTHPMQCSFVRFVPSLAVLLFAGSPASAYSIETAVSDGCHEAITTEAFRLVREERSLPQVPESRDDIAFEDDLQFTPARDMTDLAAVSLLAGVRDNDTKGRGANDLTELAEVHGDPENQREHCLRGPGQKEPDGTAAAVAACHAFILERVAEALDGLDAAGRPDGAKRVRLEVRLAIRGSIGVALPTYYVRIGQAVHALQDSFTHTYRSRDGRRITVALDWIDDVDGELDEERDGPAHAAELDRCDDPDSLRSERRHLAVEATRAVMLATLDAGRSNEKKIEAVRAILERYAGYQPGCTYANGWCDAPERAYEDPDGCGCSAPGSHRSTVWLLPFLALFGLAIRRRRRIAALLGASVVVVVLRSNLARAEPPPPETGPRGPPPPVTVPVPEPGPTDPAALSLGGHLGGSGSIDKPAFAGELGVRLRWNRTWTFGLDAEWNPFIAVSGSRVRKGVANVYGSVIVRFPMHYERINLRSTLSAGISRLLFDLYGAEEGSTGAFVGLYPLGIEVKASRAFYVVLNPLGIALAAPKLDHVPFFYPQYRVNVAVEFYSK